MNKDALLSVLMPTYNYADYICDTLKTVLDQNVEAMEVVIADDGSTDGTEDCLRPWIDSGRVRYFRQENKGPSAARNLAMSQARGSLLMLLDSDDALLPGCLATTIGFMERHPDVGFFFTNYDIFEESGVVTPSGVDIWKVFRSIPHREVGRDEWIFSVSLAPYIIRHGAFMHTSGATFRRELVERAGPFREGFFYGEDDEFYARVNHLCSAGYVDRVLSRKRNHPRSLIHDEAHRLRSARDILKLTEIQEQDYREDPELQGIVRNKLRGLAEAYAWRLIDEGRSEEARACLAAYRARFPFHLPFYKLLAKTLVPGIGRRPKR